MTVFCSCEKRSIPDGGRKTSLTISYQKFRSSNSCLYVMASLLPQTQAAYTYWTNRDNGEIFTKEEQLNWNAQREAQNKSGSNANE
jgi:hypothetical protein